MLGVQYLPVHYMRFLYIYPLGSFNFVKMISKLRHLSAPISLIGYFFYYDIFDMRDVVFNYFGYYTFLEKSCSSSS